MMKSSGQTLFLLGACVRKRTRIRTALELGQSGTGHDSKWSLLGSISGLGHYNIYVGFNRMWGKDVD